MPRCALFVDHENIWFSLRNTLGENVRGISAAALSAGLREQAEMVGEVHIASVTADWDQEDLRGQIREYIKNRFEGRYNIRGRNDADLRITNEIRDVLEDERNSEIDTFIIATGDGGYHPIVETLLNRRKTVHIWGVKGSTSPLLQAVASEFHFINDLLNLRPAAPEPSRPLHEVSDDSFTENDATEEFGISIFDVLALESKLLLTRNGWSFLTFRQLMDHLTQLNLCGDSSQEREMWFNQAVEMGLYSRQETTIHDTATQQNKIISQYHLNETSPHVEKALAVVEHVFAYLAGSLTGTRYRPGFRKVKETLAQELKIEPNDASGWLRYLISRKAITTAKTNHADPQRAREGWQVTVLALDPDNELIRYFCHVESGLEKGRSAVAIISQFLEDRQCEWMSAKLLRRALAQAILRDRTEETSLEFAENQASGIIADIQSSGWITIEQSTGQGDASKVFLNDRNKDVQETLRMKSSLVEKIASFLSTRPWVARSTVLAEIEKDTGISRKDANDWIDILIDADCISQDSIPNPHKEGIHTSVLQLPGQVGKQP